MSGFKEPFDKTWRLIGYEGYEWRNASTLKFCALWLGGCWCYRGGTGQTGEGNKLFLVIGGLN